MTKAQAALIFVLVGVLASLAALWTAPILQGWIHDLEAVSQGAPAREPAAPPDGAAAPAPRDVAAATPVPRPAQRGSEPKARAAAPRVLAVDPSGDEEAPDPADEAQGDEDTGEAAYGRVDPDVPYSEASAQKTLFGIVPEISECLGEWAEQTPAFRDRIVLEVELTPDGVQRVWLAEVTEVPPVILGCISAPVWTATWPAPDAATTFRFPITLEDSDAAAPQE